MIKSARCRVQVAILHLRSASWWFMIMRKVCPVTKWQKGWIWNCVLYIRYFGATKMKIGSIENLVLGDLKNCHCRINEFYSARCSENLLWVLNVLSRNFTQTHGKKILGQKIRNVFKSSGFYSRIARNKLYISAINKKKRLDFAKKYCEKVFWVLENSDF